MNTPFQSEHFNLHTLTEGVYAAIATEDGAGFSNAGLPFIPRPRLTRTGLAAALAALSKNLELHAAATVLGEQIRTENGVETAVSLIEETFG
jgi:UDP:flavonoid glycosyltransferase YjiC (YdhE family)